MKHLLAITFALLPSAVLAEQFTPEQMLEVMTKSSSNRGVRVHDSSSDGFARYRDGTSKTIMFVEASPLDINLWNKH